MPDIRTMTRVLDGEHVISEANGRASREGIVLGATSVKVPAGTVLGKVTATNQRVPLAPAAVDGSQNADCVLFAGKPVNTGTQKAVGHTRNCEINVNKVTWPAGITAAQKTTAIDQLAAKGVLLRA